MSNINQIVTIKLLNAISNAKTNNNIRNTENGIDTFEHIFKNILGEQQYLSSSKSCSSCNNNNIGNLNTISEYLNNNRVAGYVDKMAINSQIQLDNSISENTIASKMDDAMKLLDQQLGKKYVWGATGPNSFDCSGLTQYIYKIALGKDIPRVSYEQAEYGKSVKRKELQVGDLLFFDTMNKGRVSHVGIYIGDNEFIHASNPKDGVRKSSLSGYYEKKYIEARRP